MGKPKTINWPQSQQKLQVAKGSDWNTGEEALFKLICEVLQGKGIDINRMRFRGFDGTITMSGEIRGLQRRFRHLFQLYINCRNHQLGLLFVHLLPKYKPLADVDALIISVWKLIE